LEIRVNDFRQVPRFDEATILVKKPKCLVAISDDVVTAAGGDLGAMVQIKELNKRNRQEIERIGYEEDD